MTLHEFNALVDCSIKYAGALDHYDEREARNKAERIVKKIANRKAAQELKKVMEQITVGNNGEVYDYIKETIKNFEKHDY